MQKVLILGCGSIGERHLRCFQKTGRAEVYACEPNATLLATIQSTYNVKGFADWKQAIEQERFDAAVICTPAHLHVAMATELLRRGLHVLIEKPLSQSMNGIDSLLSAARDSGKKTAVAYVLHTYPVLTAAKEFLRRGELGPIVQATLTSGQYFPGGRPAHTAPYWKTYYADRKLGGGAVQDALTHTVNWFESVLGPTDSVICDLAHQVLPEVTVEDTVHVSARNGNTLVNYTLNQFQAPNETTLQFNAAKGSVKIEMHTRRWGIFRLGEPGWQWHELPAGERDTPFLEQASRFLDFLAGKPADLCSLEAGLQTLRFNLAALASADANGRRIRCSDLSPV